MTDEKGHQQKLFVLIWFLLVFVCVRVCVLTVHDWMIKFDCVCREEGAEQRLRQWMGSLGCSASFHQKLNFVYFI